MRRLLLVGSMVGFIVGGCGDDEATGNSDAAPGRGDAGMADAGMADAAEGADAGGSAVGCDIDNGGLTLPDGFCAGRFAIELGKARHVAVTPSGDVYVAINPDSSAPGAPGGGIIALRDTDGDGMADERQQFYDRGGTGILWRDGVLYFAPNDRVVRWQLPDGQLVPEGEPTVIVGGLPSDGDHPYKAIVLAGDDLYVNIGSATNSCQVENRETQSPGIDPCPELDTRAGVWRFPANGENLTQADGERFVTGARNLTAITHRAADDALYAVQNGRDELADDWPQLFTQEQDDRLPSEEMFRLAAGTDYGWPYCYHDPVASEKVLAPEYGGDGTIIGRCEAAAEPLKAYPAHWAPLGMHFYTGTQFPERYRGGLFIAYHGSRFAPNAVPPLPGYQVSFQPFADDEPSGDAEAFADGFAGSARPLPDRAQSRPVDVAEAPDGSLYVSDDKSGVLFRIYYVGN